MQEVNLKFGGPALLDGVNLQIEEGERVCLLGRNGAGKSTLMKLIRGTMEPDSGEISRQQALRVAYLTQEVPHDLEGTIFEVIASDFDMDVDHGAHLSIEKVLSHMKLDGEVLFQTLSAGMKRRVLLAKGLARDPHILLLDEPTNHLDIEAIKWLEGFLLRYSGTIFFVTHDRVFLQNLATRIIELDRGRLTSWDCDYSTYLTRKEALLDAEEAQNARFDKKMAEEEVWIRKGIKARRTRNEGRVRALQKMREEHRERRSHQGNVSMTLQAGKNSGRLVIGAKDISCGYGSDVVINSISTTIMRGDKVGIIGPNGVGKTTLLKTLLGKHPPISGELKLGTNLEIAYFDQLRSQIDENKTVQDNVAEGNDQVMINGKPKHIIGYLQDFLFTPDRARSPVRILSGGERNRLLLAKLFTKPSNMIVMDEPTNDLDMETLDLLEELLAEYKGTLLIVSHDRAFINNIVTSTLVFEGHGVVDEYIGGYDDWLRQKKAAAKLNKKKSGQRNSDQKISGKDGGKAARPKKMSFKEKKELEEVPQEIETLEEKKEELHKIMADPDNYQGGGEKAASAKSAAEELEERLAFLYKRWEELEEIQAALDETAS
jgi:ATP-binding cassette subfamily F protein uup